MGVIDEVMTFQEACQLWGLSEATLRQKKGKIKSMIEGVDYRKSGKVWLITKVAMEKEYGKLNTNNNEEVSHIQK